MRKLRVFSFMECSKPAPNNGFNSRDFSTCCLKRIVRKLNGGGKKKKTEKDEKPFAVTITAGCIWGKMAAASSRLQRTQQPNNKMTKKPPKCRQDHTKWVDEATSHRCTAAQAHSQLSSAVSAKVGGWCQAVLHGTRSFVPVLSGNPAAFLTPEENELGNNKPSHKSTQGFGVIKWKK